MKFCQYFVYYIYKYIHLPKKKESVCSPFKILIEFIFLDFKGAVIAFGENAFVFDFNNINFRFYIFIHLLISPISDCPDKRLQLFRSCILTLQARLQRSCYTLYLHSQSIFLLNIYHYFSLEIYIQTSYSY